MFYPLPSAYQWFSINHSSGSMCLRESALSVRLTTTTQPAYTTPKDRGDIDAQERTRVRSKPHSSSAQWHSSHSKRTLLINSVRSHRQRDRLMERYPDVALQHHISALLCHLPFFFFFLSSFHPTLCPSLSPRQVPGQTAMKMSKVPPTENKTRQKYENQLATHWEPPLFLYFFFFFFPDLSLFILFCTVARGECLSRRVCCVSPREESCRLRA